ncbi:uncharacterized protein IWZ02DRAFT_499033 [Phyllosticta citriasiana]|uniref:Uncharacterized protein n=1 Tax=Phyllosticta citriasiana TaxID=595635 RepID=A0ABR1KSN0_9PEZI
MAGLRAWGRKVKSKTKAVLRPTRKSAGKQKPVSAVHTAEATPSEDFHQNPAHEEAHDGSGLRTEDNPASIDQAPIAQSSFGQAPCGEPEGENSNIFEEEQDEEDDGWERQVSGTSTSFTTGGPRAQPFMPMVSYVEASQGPTHRDWKLARLRRYSKAAEEGVDIDDGTGSMIRELQPEEMGVRRSSFLFTPSSSSNDSTQNGREELTRPCCSSERSGMKSIFRSSPEV